MKFEIYNSSKNGHSNKKDEIKTLFKQTFSDSEGESEGALIGNLAFELMATTKEDEIYVFLATENDKICACIIFTKLTFDNKVNAFLLSPVAVLTSYQRKGVGQKLITFALDSLKEKGVELAFTYGDPNFYSKVGFSLINESTVKAPLTLSYPEGWLGKSLINHKIEPIAGHSYCVEALNKPEIW